MASGLGIRRSTTDRALDWALRQSRVVPQAWGITLGVVVLVFVFTVDVAVGPHIEFSVLYVFPVIIIAWWGSRSAALAMSAASSIAWMLVHVVEDAVRTAPLWADAIVLLTRFFGMAVIAFAIYKVRELTEDYAELAELDPLTDILNRRILFERLDAEIARCQRYPEALTVLYFDADDFKGVNDRLGHAAGDKMLCELAAAMTETLRPVDVCARVGGDEFVSVLPETDAEGARASATRLFERLHEVASRYGASISLGVVTFLTPPRSNDAAVSDADRAMYRAKAAGPGRIEFELRE